jgi:hypothetical protein
MNSCFGDTKPLREIPARVCFSKGANLKHLLIGNLLPPLTALYRHVSKVLRVRAKEEMRWIDAERNVTAMADKQTIWNVPIVNYPRSAMRFVRHMVGINSSEFVFVFFVWLARSAYPNPAAAFRNRLALIKKGLTKLFMRVRVHESNYIMSGA